MPYPSRKQRVRKASRKTQPYRKLKPRPAGPSLAAILRGGPAVGRNPMDPQRRLKKRRRKALVRRAVRSSPYSRG